MPHRLHTASGLLKHLRNMLADLAADSSSIDADHHPDRQ
jgi:hypothetical protein